MYRKNKKDRASLEKLRIVDRIVYIGFLFGRFQLLPAEGMHFLSGVGSEE